MIQYLALKTECCGLIKSPSSNECSALSGLLHFYFNLVYWESEIDPQHPQIIVFFQKPNLIRPSSNICTTFICQWHALSPFALWKWSQKPLLIWGPFFCVCLLGYYGVFEFQVRWKDFPLQSRQEYENLHHHCFSSPECHNNSYLLVYSGLGSTEGLISAI